MHPPLDKRVFDKEAISLAKNDFDVLHIAPDEVASEWNKDGIKIIAYFNSRRILGRIFHTLRLYKYACKIDADVYHCNEVDSWLVGMLLKFAHGKRIVFDVHEHYPSAFAESRFPLWMRPFVSGAIRLGFRALAPFTDRLVFAKRSVAIDFPGTEHKQVLVQNFTSLAYQNAERQEVARNREATDNTVTAIHLGLISRVRGWPQLLEALARAQSQNLHLHIVGTFNDGSQAEFEKRVSELGLAARVRVEEWMPFAQAYERILASHIGLVLFQPGIQNHVYALPHKMFDYMLAGLPVIAPGFAVEVAPIIQEADCGILLDPSDSQQIANALDRLAVNPQERERLGENGRRAVLEQYNWEAEAEKLISMYVELADSSKK